MLLNWIGLFKDYFQLSSGECEVFSDNFAVSTRDCLTSKFNYIINLQIGQNWYFNQVKLQNTGPLKYLYLTESQKWLLCYASFFKRFWHMSEVALHSVVAPKKILRHAIFFKLATI